MYIYIFVYVSMYIDVCVCVCLIFECLENAITGDILGTVLFSDPDEGDILQINLEGNIFDGIEWFSINEENEIVFNKNAESVSLDYETKGYYTIKATVTDSGNLSAENNLSIIIQDVNEAPFIVSFFKS